MTDQEEGKAISEEIHIATNTVRFELNLIEKLVSCLVKGHLWIVRQESPEFPGLIQTRKCDDAMQDKLIRAVTGARPTGQTRTRKFRTGSGSLHLLHATGPAPCPARSCHARARVECAGSRCRPSRPIAGLSCGPLSADCRSL